MTPPSDPSIPTVAEKHSGHRAWIPLGVLALAVANIVRVRGLAELAGNFKTMQIMLTIVISILLVLIWFLFLSRFRWRARVVGLATLIALGIGVKTTLRIDGSVNGSGVPKVAWKWTPKRTGVVTGVQQAAAPANVQESAGDSPGYLGRERTGVVAQTRLEKDWNGHPPQQLWRHEVGLGWSGFATIGGCALTQEQRADAEMVVCYELATGRTLWTHSDPVRFSEPMGGDGPRATPTIANDRVYALGGTGLLNCLDLATGAVLWSHKTLEEYHLPNLPFGKSSSPLVCDDLVIVGGGDADSCTLLAYHCSDGSPAWQAGTDKAGYSSPTVATLAGKRQIVSINGTSVSGHDLSDGHALWSYRWGGDQPPKGGDPRTKGGDPWPKCAQPVVLDGDRILLAASFSAGTVLLQIKAAADGSLSAVELWKNHNLKSEFSNVVARDGCIYGLDDGILVCLDAATGRRKWKEGRYGNGQVVLVGNLLLVQMENGPVALVEASPDGFHEVSKLPALGAKTWNTPTVSGDLLLVRNDQEAACYRLATVP